MDRSRSKGDYFRTLERRISDLQKQVDVLVNRDQSIPPIYIGASGAPAFQSGWVNYGTGADGQELLNIRKDSAGNVQLRGLIKDGTFPGPIFTLPLGYRPSHYSRFAVVSGSAFCHIECWPTFAGGYVYMYTGSATWLDLSSIIFQPVSS